MYLQYQGALDDPDVDEQALNQAAQARAAQGTEPNTDDWAERLEDLRRVATALHEELDPLGQALLGQVMGWDDEVQGQALARRFGVSPVRVSQRRKALVDQLAQAMGVMPG